MIKDIYPYFKLNSKGEHYGFFIDFKPAPFYLGRAKGNCKVWSDWGNYNFPVGTYNGREYTLIDMFHGSCHLFARYFQYKNPTWTIGLLLGLSSLVSVKHAFCYQQTDDGRILFADARGITDSVEEFFSDFAFSKKNMLMVTPDLYSSDEYEEYLSTYCSVPWNKPWDTNQLDLKSAVESAYALMSRGIDIISR